MKKKIFLIMVFFFAVRLLAVDFPLIQSLAFFPYLEDKAPDYKNFSLSFSLINSNIYSLEHTNNTFVDLETLSLSGDFRYGLSKKISLDFNFKISYFYGGFFDGLTENFHNFFNMPSNYREIRPRNSVHYTYKEVFLYENKSINLSPFLLGLSYKFIQNKDFSLTGRVSFAIPLYTKKGINSTKFFINCGFVLNWHLNDNWDIKAVYYRSYFQRPNWSNTNELKENINYYKVALAYKKLELFFIGRSSPFIQGDFANTAYQMGISYKLSSKLYLIFIEDLILYDTSPDFSLGIKYKLK